MVNLWEEKALLTHKKLNQLYKECGGSFYLLDTNKLKENYRKMHHAFSSRYENFIIGYSYKTNYLPYLCKELDELGAYSEVVSRLEYDLAIKLGVDPQKIIFNGPLKGQEDINYALKNKSKINLDSNFQMNLVKDYCLNNKNETIKIGLRVNFDLSENGKSPIVDGYEVSRFGICVENGELAKILDELNDIKNIKIVGLHGHVSTQKRDLETYAKITEGLCNIAKTYELTDLEYIDIGGGISGEVPKSLKAYAPTFGEYAEVICSIMSNEYGSFKRKPTLILEPGISMVANTFIFVAKVIDIKKVRNQKFVLLDGCVQNIKAAPSKKNLPMRIVRKDRGSIQSKEIFNLVGYTCIERDYLAYDVYDEIPHIGDYILFEHVGAYTIVLTPPFIKERPAIIAYEDNEIIVVRKKETFEQFFDKSLYSFD